jgi:hypothetical protein
MATTAVVTKSQKDRALNRAERLVSELKEAQHFGHVKDAVMSFVADMDGQSNYEDSPIVLGDGDFAGLLIDSLERRGKTPIQNWAPPLIMGAKLDPGREAQAARIKLKGLPGDLGE